MKALATYGPDADYRTLSEDTTHILVPLETNTVTKGFAQGFYDLLIKIRDTEQQEATLTLTVARAEGFIVAVDAEIDVLVTNTLTSVAAAFGKASALYVFLVGDQTPGEIRAPVLAEELDTVKTWVGPLQGCSDAVVQGYGLALEKKIAEADQRVAELAKAEQALEEFCEIGPRKELLDSANAQRASVYGAINQLLSTPAGAGLPADFADRIFQFERARRRRKALTVKDVEKLVAVNDKERQKLLAQLAEKKAEEAKAAQEKAKKKAKPVQDALEAAKKKATEMQAEIAALEAQLGAPPPSSP